jgi:hypothetical protein
VPYRGYRFLNWTNAAGSVVSYANPLILTNVTTDMKIRANFTIGRLKADFTFSSE